MKKKIVTVIAICLVFALCFITMYDLGKKKSDLTTVKVAEVAHSIFYAPQYAAISEGFFEEYGIDVDLTLASGADKVIAAVLSNDVDIGFSGWVVLL